MADKNEEKVFDVQNPEDAKPEIGTKPMIVGHKSLASDPMVKTDAFKDDKKPDEIPAPSEVNKTLEPISDEMKKESDEIIDDKIIEDKVVDENKSAGVETDTEEKIETKSEESKEKLDENTEEESKDDSKKDKDDKKIDPTAEAMEREEKLNKIIESKKYNVNIKEKKSGSLKSFLTTFIIVVLVAIVAIFVLIDTGFLKVNYELPFRIFGKEDTAVQPTQTTIAIVNTEQPKDEETVLDTSNWLLYKSSGYSMKIPDGFLLSKTQGSDTDLTAAKIQYQDGTKAIVQDIVSTSPTSEAYKITMYKNNEQQCSQLITQAENTELTTQSGLKIIKAVPVDSLASEDGAVSDTLLIGSINKYCVEKNGNTILVTYVKQASDSEELISAIEQSIKSITFTE